MFLIAFMFMFISLFPEDTLTFGTWLFVIMLGMYCGMADLLVIGCLTGIYWILDAKAKQLKEQTRQL